MSDQKGETSSNLPNLDRQLKVVGCTIKTTQALY